MGRLIPIQLKKFYGGISDDVRQQSDQEFFLSKNFDIFSNPARLTPYRDTESDNTVSSTSSTMTQFKVENFVAGNSSVYGIGRRSSGSSLLRILEKSTSNVPSGNWSLSASASQTTNGVPTRTATGYFKGYIYGIKVAGSGSSNKADLWRYGSVISGTKALTVAYGGADLLTISDTTISDGRVAMPIVGKDDNLYLPYENKLCRVDDTHSVTAAALTLPSNLQITSLTTFGIYLAIGTKPVSQAETSSKVFLWDYHSDDITDVIDWGEGSLLVLENIDGVLVGISDVGGGSSLAIDAKTVVAKWSGGEVDPIKELPYSGLSVKKFKKANRLYFTLTESSNKSIWVVGRLSKRYPMAITCDRLVNKNTNVTTVHGFTFIGDYFFASHGDDGDIAKTDDSANFNATSSVVTQKINGGDLTRRKKLHGVALAYAPLPTAGIIALDYRVDEETSWTEIFRENTDNSIYHEALLEETAQVNFKDFNEIQFRVRSTGKAEPVELKALLEELDSQISTTVNES